MSDAEDFADLIELALRQFLAASTPDNYGLRKLAAKLHALPVCQGWLRCLAIKPDGQVISFAIDSWDGTVLPPGEMRVEEHPVIRNFAFDEASKRFPILHSLAPKRSPDDVECSDCGGTGDLPLPNMKVKCCSCGGLGWLPSNTSKGTNDWA